MKPKVSKSALRQALHYRFHLPILDVARLTKSSVAAVKETVEDSRCQKRKAKTWKARSRQERHEAIVKAQVLVNRKKIA